MDNAATAKILAVILMEKNKHCSEPTLAASNEVQFLAASQQREIVFDGKPKNSLRSTLVHPDLGNSKSDIWG